MLGKGVMEKNNAYQYMSVDVAGDFHCVDDNELVKCIGFLRRYLTRY